MKKVLLFTSIAIGVILVAVLADANVAATIGPSQLSELIDGDTPEVALFLPYLSNPLAPTPTGTPLPLPQNLTPVADTTILQGRPNNNYNNFADMLAGYDVSGCHLPPEPGFKISRSLLRFDTSTIPSGTTIVQATLHINKIGACWSSAATGETRSVKAYRIDSDWSESTVNWNSQPGYAEAYGSAAIPLTFNAPDWYSLDVTELVRDWVNGTLPNQGLIVRGPENSSGNTAVFGFATTQWPSTSRDPYISITYAGAATTDPIAYQKDTSHTMTCEQLPSNMTVCQLELGEHLDSLWSAQDD